MKFKVKRAKYLRILSSFMLSREIMEKFLYPMVLVMYVMKTNFRLKKEILNVRIAQMKQYVLAASRCFLRRITGEVVGTLQISIHAGYLKCDLVAKRPRIIQVNV